VIALEDDETLISSVEKLCENTGVCNVIALEAAHEKGFPKHGPYDLIMVNGACAEMPTVLAGQLAPEGRLLYVHAGSRGRSGAIQIVTKQTGLGKTGFSSYTLFDAYAPYLKGFEPQAKFVFS
jgi:protein-L-isoaspartate(D-aspartate) O-methyltransferase